MLARDFIVEPQGERRSYLDVARAPEAGADPDQPKLAEWVVPVSWTKALTREDAIKDSDLFANQNSAVKLTHEYTLVHLKEALGLSS
jgi:hypothetical protein